MTLAFFGQTSQPARTVSEPFVSSSGSFGQVRVELQAPARTVRLGEPVWVDFVVRNVGESPVELIVASRAGASAASMVMGLPIEHVFSGRSWRALAISDGIRKRLGEGVRREPAGSVSPVQLAPHASVGLRLDVAVLYPALRKAGRYTLTWRPYGGLAVSNDLVIQVDVIKQVRIRTDLGEMTIELLYNKAPQHVANFLNLAGSGLYDGTTLWRVVGGALVQGGDPKGDGSGMRPDGKTLVPEFNDTKFKEGTVGMALVPGDANTASCQFLIALRRLGFLDGRCTAFGQVTGATSLATLRRIGATEVDDQDRPVQPIRIRRVVIEPAKRLDGSEGGG